MYKRDGMILHLGYCVLLVSIVSSCHGFETNRNAICVTAAKCRKKEKSMCSAQSHSLLEGLAFQSGEHAALLSL